MTHRKSVFQRLAESFVSSPVGTWMYLNVLPPLDRRILRWTNGHLSMSPGQPVLLLTTLGARSGELRETPLVYTRSRQDVVLIASNGGSSKHPAWYHNIKKNPEVELIVKNGSGKYTAREAVGEERDALWQKALVTYGGYDVYKERASNASDRQIPVIVLTHAD